MGALGKCRVPDLTVKVRGREEEEQEGDSQLVLVLGLPSGQSLPRTSGEYTGCSVTACEKALQLEPWLSQVAGHLEPGTDPACYAGDRNKKHMLFTCKHSQESGLNLISSWGVVEVPRTELEPYLYL